MADRILFVVNNPRVAFPVTNPADVADIEFSTAIGGGQRKEGRILVKTLNSKPWVQTVAENSYEIIFSSDQIAKTAMVEFSNDLASPFGVKTQIDIAGCF